MNVLVFKNIEIVKRYVAVITSINGLSTTVAFNNSNKDPNEQNRKRSFYRTTKEVPFE